MALPFSDLEFCLILGDSALQVDKFALDALNENAEGYMQNLEQWIMVCANCKIIT